MSLQPLELTFNLVMILFWISLWTFDERTVYFNPYVTNIHRIVRPVVRFLQPAFWRWSVRRTTIGILALIVIFRALLYPLLGPATVRQFWAVGIGFELVRLRTVGLPACLVFSLMSFAVFLFKYWCVCLLFLGVPRGGGPGRAAEFVYETCRPFSLVPYAYRPLVLLLFGMTLLGVLNMVGGPHDLLNRSPILVGSLGPVTVLRYAVLSLAGWVASLQVLRAAMLVLIIASWVAMMSAGGALMLMSREWLNLILGPFRRVRVVIGMFDLTPLIALVLIHIVYGVLSFILQQIYIVTLR